MKRKSESQGGEVKRRRPSNPVESSPIEKSSPIPTQKDPSITNPVSNSPVSVMESTVIALPTNTTATKIMAAQGLPGFDHYSDSEEDSE